MQAVKGILGATALALLSACGGDKTPELMNIRSQSRAPDEFAILPGKPLQLPEDTKALPDPTPGGANLADPTPEADAVAAMGGNPARMSAGGVPAGDGGLVAYAGRFGSDGAIRSTLAAEDLDYRRKHDGRLLERVFNVSVYFRAYEPMSLDQYAELERWRQAGVRNVGAPPEGVEAQ